MGKGDLNGSGAAGKHIETMVGKVAGEFDENIDLVAGEEGGERGVIKRPDVAPVIRDIAVGVGVLGMEGARHVEVAGEVFAILELHPGGEEAEGRVHDELAGEVADAEGAAGIGGIGKGGVGGMAGGPKVVGPFVGFPDALRGSGGVVEHEPEQARVEVVLLGGRFGRQAESAALGGEGGGRVPGAPGGEGEAGLDFKRGRSFNGGAGDEGEGLLVTGRVGGDGGFEQQERGGAGMCDEGLVDKLLRGGGLFGSQKGLPEGSGIGGAVGILAAALFEEGDGVGRAMKPEEGFGAAMEGGEAGGVEFEGTREGGRGGGKIIGPEVEGGEIVPVERIGGVLRQERFEGGEGAGEIGHAPEGDGQGADRRWREALIADRREGALQGAGPVARLNGGPSGIGGHF